MTRRDLLTEATRALQGSSRETVSSEVATRERVIRALVRRQKVQRAGMVAASVVVVMLFTSTTVAAITGRLPEVMDRLMSWVSFDATPEPVTDPEPEPRSEQGSSPEPMRPEREPRPEPTPRPGQEPRPEPTPEATHELAPEVVSRRPIARNPEGVIALPAAEVSQPPEHGPGEEEPAGLDLPTNPHELYTRAHQLHFDQGNYRVALAAWNRYIRDAPQGQFIMEARYNRAIALAQLGRRQAAIEALRPFAEGRFRGYQQRNAAQWIEALLIDPLDRP